MTFEPMYLPVHVFPTTNSPNERSDMYQIPVTFDRLPIALYVKLHGGLHVCRDPSHINEGYPQAVRGSSCSPFGLNHIHVYPEYRRSWQCPRLNASGNILCATPSGRTRPCQLTRSPFLSRDQGSVSLLWYPVATRTGHCPEL